MIFGADTFKYLLRPRDVPAYPPHGGVRARYGARGFPIESTREGEWAMLPMESGRWGIGWPRDYTHPMGATGGHGSLLCPERPGRASIARRLCCVKITQGRVKSAQRLKALRRWGLQNWQEGARRFRRRRGAIKQCAQRIWGDRVKIT